MDLPPDRGHVATEQRPHRAAGLDTLSIKGCVTRLINDHAAIGPALVSGSDSLVDFIEVVVERVRDGGRLIYVGAGTSGRLGVLDASECPPTFHSDPSTVVGIIAGGDAALRQSSEHREDDPEGARGDLGALEVGAGDAVLGIAAGGTTPYVLGAIRIAAGQGATTGLLTCAIGTALPEGCDHLVVLPTGPEAVTGSTRLKAGTVTKVALNIITTTLFVQRGKVHGDLMVDLRATSDKLRDRAIRILQELCSGIDRTGASSLLERADGRVKPAVVMHHAGVDLDEARRLLAIHDEQLGAVISPPVVP